MPLSAVGLRAENRIWSWSVYSRLVENPPPVARRHKASESQAGKDPMLSRATHHPLMASM